ncbi:MAG: class I SAM-dependent methyltransferase [Bacteroidia bacterium]|nr:class I SAM-dependent methyltransferase [Bacteroidia bacterium]
MAYSQSELYPVHLTPGGPPLSRDLLLQCPPELLRREDAQLLLVGCRFGEHLITLPYHFAGRITGIEEDSEAVLYGKMAIAQAGMAERVSIMMMSPLATRFQPGQFDVIILEGAFSSYPAGKVLKEAKRLLSDTGMLLFSDSCWLEPDVPVFARQVWESREHKILHFDETVALFRDRGFDIIATVDQSRVLGGFYAQFRDAAQSIAREKFEGLKHLKALVKHYKHEIDVYHKHGGKRYMGYMSIVAKHAG